ncbi:hypothetical protein CB1_002798011 [Camelus ferus]|nr:hypothetical protein CB1_002798011 [Camelus ferus]
MRNVESLWVLTRLAAFLPSRKALRIRTGSTHRHLGSSPGSNGFPGPGVCVLSHCDRGPLADHTASRTVAQAALPLNRPGPPNHHSQSTLRPPLPPPHNHTLSHHHSSANSLNRNSLTNRRSQIHAPAPAPNDLATTPESVQLQDSWVLNSNVPLETRDSIQSYLPFSDQSGKDVNIQRCEMYFEAFNFPSLSMSACIFIKASKVAVTSVPALVYSERNELELYFSKVYPVEHQFEDWDDGWVKIYVIQHFLFKTSSGSTPLFSSSSPGYPLTSGTVYTPPPRLLPRNTFSRKAFKLKKPSKYCSWKCAALSAIAAALLLAILLAYFIASQSKPTGQTKAWLIERIPGADLTGSRLAVTPPKTHSPASHLQVILPLLCNSRAMNSATIVAAAQQKLDSGKRSAIISRALIPPVPGGLLSKQRTPVAPVFALLDRQELSSSLGSVADVSIGPLVKLILGQPWLISQLHLEYTDFPWEPSPAAALLTRGAPCCI